jgi:hypothetical protein
MPISQAIALFAQATEETFCMKICNLNTTRSAETHNCESNIDLVVDDDKVFGQNNPKKDTYGLRYTKHIKDN